MIIKKAKGGKNSVIGIIPARFASTRLPAKALLDIHGKPMVQHVYESCLNAKLLDKVLVATDDKRIFDAVIKFGGYAVMTSPRHRSGTDRIGEAVAKISCNIIVNIQGDEPFINHRNIDKAVEPLINDNSINFSTLAFRLGTKYEINDPNTVKVAFDRNNFALYFSRSPIPFYRDRTKKVVHYKHIGLYVYRKRSLQELVKLKPGRLEKAEKLEQLRILESGGKIKVVVTNIDSLSVDTMEDLIKIRKLAHV